jgi:predicted amidophosphoribosyltransferase
VAPVERLLLSPRAGPGVCATCFNLIDGYERCYACAHGRDVLDAFAPISYSVAHEPLHQVLFGYKRLSAVVAGPLANDLQEILRRFLEGHERCVAQLAGTSAFDLVTSVPSGERHRDDDHPLPRVVAAALGRARRRHERLLLRSSFESGHRAHDFLKYLAVRPFDGESVLLIDDTWTTGANAQSAAAALKAAGAGAVGAIAIGRHVNRDWHENDRRLTALVGRFDWASCALCAATASGARPRLGDGASGAISPGLAVAGKHNGGGVNRLDRIE